MNLFGYPVYPPLKHPTLLVSQKYFSRVSFPSTFIVACLFFALFSAQVIGEAVFAEDLVKDKAASDESQNTTALSTEEALASVTEFSSSIA